MDIGTSAEIGENIRREPHSAEIGNVLRVRRVLNNIIWIRV